MRVSRRLLSFCGEGVRGHREHARKLGPGGRHGRRRRPRFALHRALSAAHPPGRPPGAEASFWQILTHADLKIDEGGGGGIW